MTKYGYARVSTASQSTKEQIQQLLENGVEKKNIFSEKFTGTKRDRPKFNQLLAGLKPGDEIVVTKLDRFARNTREALEIIEPLLDDNVTIKVLNLGTIENTSLSVLSRTYPEHNVVELAGVEPASEITTPSALHA